ncbi:TetR/AcrR family transcriptional regulator [Lachnospiraceae bacterium ZAX-1]
MNKDKKIFINEKRMIKLSRGKRWFKEEEKEVLRNNLCKECEKCWRIYGYKKTGIGLLTKSVGISAGAFYALYHNKEELFYKSLVNLRIRLKSELKEILQNSRNKTGFKQAVMWLYREYIDAPFLYNFGSEDFVAFVSKLSIDEMAFLRNDAVSFLSILFDESGLNLKIDIKTAYETLTLLLFTVSGKDKLSCNHEDAFVILLEGVISNIFE